MPRRMLGLLGVSLLMGCSVFQPHKDLVAMGKVHVEPISTNEAELPPPKVIMSGDVMTISGVVKRKPNYNGPLDGHVKIELLDASQKVIGQFPTEWTPSEGPVNGKRQADYSLEYGWVPPGAGTPDSSPENPNLITWLSEGLGAVRNEPCALQGPAG